MCSAASGAKRGKNPPSISSIVTGSCNVLTVREKRHQKGSPFRNPKAWEGFTIPKPEGMDRLFEYAEKLSKPFPFVRADFYLERGQAYFGELTFTPGGGYDMNRLPETQLKFGQMVTLPQKRS